MAINNTMISNPSPTRIFFASTGTEFAITTIIFCNTNVAFDADLDVFVVPNGGVPATTNLVLNKITVPRTETFVMDTEKLILASGDAVWAQASPANADQIVCATVSSVQI